MLTKFGPEIWLSDGPVVDGIAGFHYPTRMIVIRLSDGSLFLWSPVALTAALREAVDRLGPVRHLIAPNALHHLALTEWQAAYPGALLHHAPGITAKRPDLRRDAPLGEIPHPAWAEELDQYLIDNRIAPEVVFYHRASATVIFTDLLQHLPRNWYSGWRAVIARLDLMTAPGASVPRKFRLAIRDRAATRRIVDALLASKIKRLVFAHGEPVKTGAHRALASAFAWLR